MLNTIIGHQQEYRKPEDARIPEKIVKNFCIYTVLMGNYERLNEQPVSKKTDIPFICFTDNANLQSKTWQIRMVEPAFPRDPVRSQRDLKIRPHAHISEFDCSMYIDNSVVLSALPDQISNLSRDDDSAFFMPLHSFRENVLDEFLEVSRSGMDDSGRIFEQLNHYLLDFPGVLDEPPWWTAIMIRDHRNPRLRLALEIWALHVMRYSRRDQLSVNVALRSAGVTPVPLRIDNFASGFHSWPHVVDRDRQRGDRDLARSLMPFPARLRATEQRAEDDASAFARRFEELSAAHAAVLGSRSWRLTEPLRRLSTHVRAARAALRGMPRLGLRMAAAAGAVPVSPPDRVRGQAGHWIHVDGGDARGRALAEAGGSLNPLSLEAWQLLLAEAEWTHVVDVGANYGEMLVNGGLPPGASVTAVEPNPAACERLRRTLSDADIAAEILQVAVSDIEGEGQLKIDPEWSGKTRLARSDEADGLPVRMTTLGAIARNAGVPLPRMRMAAKIDVEGHEAGVLRGIMRELPDLGDFAALVEVLHTPPDDLAWMERSFDVAALRLGAPRALVPVPAGQLRTMLAGGAFYPQDVVLRRRPAGRPTPPFLHSPDGEAG